MRTCAVDGEDVFVYEYFKRRPGRFLDLGAGDGRHISNTWLLAEAGWDGDLVEGDPYNFTKLRENYWHFFGPKCEAGKFRLACGAVGPDTNPAPVDWLVPTVPGCDMNSTAHEATLKAGSAWGGGPRRHLMASFSVSWLLNRWAGLYDFVSIDLEGYSLSVCAEVLRYAPKLVCVEVLSAAEIESTSGAAAYWKYRQIHATSENVFLEHV
jgi:hypothetical protein